MTTLRLFAISEELMNEILGYLGTKPYMEVAGIINKIAQATKQPPAADPPPPAKE
jgi:hypothetical protein